MSEDESHEPAEIAACLACRATDRPLSPLGVCVECETFGRKIVTPHVREFIEEARQTKIGKELVSFFDDWATGRRARKEREQKP